MHPPTCLHLPLKQTLLSLAILVLPSCAARTLQSSPIGPEFAKMQDRATQLLLQKELAARGPQTPLHDVQVAVLPPQFTGTVAGGSSESEIHASIARSVSNSGIFVPVSRHLIRNAVNASGVSDAQALLGLADARERFMTVLADNGFIPEYLVLPEITTMQETAKGRVVWRKTTLNLQLARSDNGVVAHEQFDSVIQSVK